MITPWIVLGPLAGVLADRWRKRRTLIGCDLARTLLAAALLSAYDTHTALLAMTCFDVRFAPSYQRGQRPMLAEVCGAPR